MSCRKSVHCINGFNVLTMRTLPVSAKSVEVEAALYTGGFYSHTEGLCILHVCVFNLTLKTLLFRGTFVWTRCKHLKRPYLALLGFPVTVVCYIGFCACKWSAKAKIPKFTQAVSLPHTPPLPAMPLSDYSVYFCYMMTSLRNTHASIG